MTFKHKLSKRLAISWAAVLLTGIVTLGCTGDASISAPTRMDAVSSAAGATTLLQESFEDNSFAARGWYDNTAMATTTAQHIPGSTRALEIRFPAGATNPTWGGSARRLFQPSPTLYISYWVKYSDNWVGSGRAYHPHEFLVMSDLDGDYDGPSNNWLTAYVEANFQNGGIPRLQLQDSKAINTSLGALPNNLVATTENRSIGGCNGVAEANVVTSCFSFPPWYNDKELIASRVWFQPTAGPGYKGNWNHVEVYLQINSIANGVGRADGVMQYWFNGALAIDRHDILFRTGARPNINFRQFLIAPYIGDGSPVDQTMWVDDITVATGIPSVVPGPSVASITVSPASTSVAIGGTTQFTATLNDSAGNVLTGHPVTWTSSSAGVATVNGSGLASALSAGSTTITASSGGKIGSATLGVTAAVTNPGTVTDLAVAAATDTSLTLSFTDVTDGAGNAARYDVRWAAGAFSWGAATEVARGTCAVPLAGTTIGAKRTCTVLGLTKSTAYQFQLVALRGTLNVDAVFGALSNVASGTTAGAGVAPVATVAVSPASASLTVGTTRQLAATLKDAAGITLTGRTVTWASSNVGSATVSANGLVTAIAAGSATITATSEGKNGTAAMTVTAQVVTNPGKVTNLAVAGLTTNSVTLSFTEVTGGTGLPANYQVRFAAAPVSWGSGTDVSAGTCKVPMAGTTIGAQRTCTVTGLATSRAYQFQLVAYRGTLNVNAVFGALSNVASGTTAATAPAPAAPVATVAVSPANASLTVAGTQSYATTLKDSAGITLTGRTVTWGSSNAGIATVSGSGLVTAIAAGSATITATSEGKSGSAAVAVSVAPPPPPTGGNWPNEPAGFTLLTDEPFNALVENGWHQVQRQTTNGSGLFLATDLTAPQSLSSVLEFKYAAGYTGGSEPGVEYYNPSSPVKETYFSFWWKPSSGWQNHSGSGVNKLAFIFPSAGTCIYIMMFNEGGGYTMQVEPEFSGDTRRLAPNVTGTQVVLGAWHRVEWYVKYSTTGSSRDGVTRWWLDGVLQGDYRDLQMPGDAGFTEYQLAPTWGGIGGTKSQTDYYWYDHARISKQ